MKHKIFELATIEDVPEILEIQHQAFAPQCKALGWNDCLPLNETLDSAYEDFGNFKTFKIQNDDGKIIGSVRGHVTDGSLLIGHLVVHPLTGLSGTSVVPYPLKDCAHYRCALLDRWP